jgi:hypothetical protein
MIPKQNKKIWKWTKYDQLIPVTNFIDGLEIEDSKISGFKNEKVKGIKDKENTSKITIFRGGKMDETLINHSELLDKSEKSKSKVEDEEDGEEEI